MQDIRVQIRMGKQVEDLIDLTDEFLQKLADEVTIKVTCMFGNADWIDTEVSVPNKSCSVRGKIKRERGLRKDEET